MRWAALVIVLVAGIIAALVLATSHMGPGRALYRENGTNGSSSGPVYVQHTLTPEVTALYTKNISAETPFIIVDLYSGDPDDPVTLSVIAPDKALGPYTDISDGRKDGRIYLKISRDGGLTPGVWVFRVQSSKNIAVFNWVPKPANTSTTTSGPDSTGIEVSRPENEP